ncbi:Surfeit locus 1/Shy1 [Arabidopsis thaliana x Arabidopsis arenosa]|uniref:Surfeit locus 1/Shy1 n=1 Tax=Arabidopsis thaliana x Arabidopsis arenosa TaxID=1240361 RepID=A0A8T1XEE6_9BRAS|nr:Surfeit locus 1/Shy1 [Arabidopsis thaliana x Arabidopsis arenosa]
MVEKLGLKVEKHLRPYKLQWLNETREMSVNRQVKVPLSIGKYEDEILCDILPMDASHILLGRPWQTDRKVTHEGFTNRQIFDFKGGKSILVPMTPHEEKTDLRSNPFQLGEDDVIMPSLGHGTKGQFKDILDHHVEDMLDHQVEDVIEYGAAPRGYSITHEVKEPGDEELGAEKDVALHATTGSMTRKMTFWSRIANYFAASPTLVGMPKREFDHCKQRWRKINDQVCKFVGSLAAAISQKSSGQNENDEWCAASSPAQNDKSKRRKVGDRAEAAGQSSSSQTTSHGDEAMARPPGVRTSMYQSYGGRRCLMSLPKQFWSRDLSVVANSSSSTSTALGIQSSSSAPPQENKRGSKWSQLLLFLPGAITFSLGSWQIVRREEKFKTLKYQ